MHKKIQRCYSFITPSNQMTEKMNSTDNFASSVHVVTAVAMSSPDIESTGRHEPTASHVGYQIKLDPQQVAAVAAANEDEGDNDGKELGIALFLIILVGCIAALFLPVLSIACGIAAAVIASVLICGICCVGNYNSRPHVKKKWAAATLVAMCLLIVAQIIGVIIMFNVAGEEMSSPGTIGNSTLHDTMEALLPVCVAIYIIYGSLLAVVVVLHVLWVRYLPCNTYDVLV